MYMKLCAFLIIALISSMEGAICAPLEAKYMATVVSVDGDGAPKVRRRKGTESVAGAGQQIFPGDTIYTDNRSAVNLALPDGTVVRVGLSTEYKLENVRERSGVLNWVFQLARGSIRALVEKSPDKKHVKFRVNTPAGTMGVRGTELVLTHKAPSGITTLYTIEGEVEFGRHSCPKVQNCLSVTAGKKASIGLGNEQPSQVEAFSSEELLLGMGSNDEKTEAQGAEKTGTASNKSNLDEGGNQKDPGPHQLNHENLALFEELKKAGGYRDAKDLGDISEMVRVSSEKMAALQDELLERDKQTREAMNAAKADGTYAAKIRVAEKFDDLASGVKKTKQERQKESLSGSLETKKFQLSEAILKSGKIVGGSGGASSSRTQVAESGGTSAWANGDKSSNGSDPSYNKAGANKNAPELTFLEEARALIARKDEGVAQAALEAAVAEEYFRQQAAQAQAPAQEGEANTPPATNPLAAQPLYTAEKQVVEELLKDQVISSKYEALKAQYTYLSHCPVVMGIPLFCSKDVKVGGSWYSKKTGTYEKQGTTTTVERKSGKCYKTVTVKYNELIPCNLSTGKFCNSGGSFKESTKTSRVEVPCP